jgi:hypothetical protein
VLCTLQMYLPYQQGHTTGHAPVHEVQPRKECPHARVSSCYSIIIRYRLHVVRQGAHQRPHAPQHVPPANARGAERLGWVRELQQILHVSKPQRH